jgi:hypothetical protein
MMLCGGIVAPSNTRVVRLDGSSSSVLDASVAVSVDAPETRKLTFDDDEGGITVSTFNLGPSLACEDAEEDMGEPDAAPAVETVHRVSPTRPKLTRCNAIAKNTQKEHTGDDSRSSESPTFRTPTPMLPRRSDTTDTKVEYVGVRPARSLDAMHQSREGQSSSALTSDSNSPELVVVEERRRGQSKFEDILSKDVIEAIHDVLIDLSLDGNDGDADTDGEVDSDSWLPMLRYRMSHVPRRRGVSKPHRDATIGLCLLRCADITAQSLDGVLIRYAQRAQLLERDVVDRSNALYELVSRIPSSRLRRTLHDMHHLSLESIQLEHHTHALALQRAHLNAILDDPRLNRGVPKTPNDAFDYVCALCLEGRLSAL